MPKRFDCAVIGLGLAGSATLDALARRGISAIGLDQFSLRHAKGSSHGATRLLRVAYFEAKALTPWARHAVSLWKALEHRRKTKLFFAGSGVLCGGQAHSEFLESTREAAAAHSVRFTDLDSCPPQFDFGEDFRFAVDHEAGYVRAEASLQAFQDEAVLNGAIIRDQCRCLSIEPANGRVLISTEGGDIDAGHVVVTTGAWVSELLPDLAPFCYTERQVLYWFRDEARRFLAENGFRPFAVEVDGHLFYGFPTDGDNLVKVADHNAGVRVGSISEVGSVLTNDDLEGITYFVERHMPLLGPFDRHVVCMYPQAQDDMFILDRHPSRANVTIGVGLSGHGFKFGPAIGEALANFATNGQQVDAFPGDLVSVRRFLAN